MKASSFVIFFVFGSLLFSCVDSKDTIEVLVVNLKEESSVEKENFLQLNLDGSHPNLLNPSISKDSLEVVYNSWMKLHTDLNDFLKQRKFEWGIDKQNIKLFNKIYFNENGCIKAYAFRIYDSISKEKENEYKKLIKDFTRKVKISIRREESFAQCGKILLPNN